MKSPTFVFQEPVPELLAELDSLKIPAVLVPLTKEGSRGDQLLNAEYFVEKSDFQYFIRVLFRFQKLTSAFTKASK